jgi:hypothetical protein
LGYASKSFSWGQGVGFYRFLGGQLPNFRRKKYLNFPSDYPNGWHFLIAKNPKSLIQQGF